MDTFLITNKGNRECNEDAAAIYNGENNWAVIVADGLGGHGKGEVASNIATNVMKELFTKATNEFEWSEFWKQYFPLCESRLVESQRETGQVSGIKTTVVAAGITPSEDGRKMVVHPAHVGDSRLYFFHRNKIRFQTLDHSVPQMLVFAGEIKPKEIRNHPDRNRLMKAMGQNTESVYYEEHDALIAVKGDALLLCSDGFWELITEKEMEKCLKKAKSAQEWAEAMEKIVVQSGQGRDMDNYTVITVRI